MYNETFIDVIGKIINKKISKEELLNYLLDCIDCEKIYDSEDQILSDAYFSMKHYASGEEKIEEKEWIYLLECLKGENQYDIQEKCASQLSHPQMTKK